MVFRKWQNVVPFCTYGITDGRRRTSPNFDGRETGVCCAKSTGLGLKMKLKIAAENKKAHAIIREVS